MEGMLVCLFVIAQTLVSCQVQEATLSPDPPPTTTHNPYANVLSQLSDAMLDVEDRLYRLTAPKYESEDSKAVLDAGESNRRRNYFDRIRDNYKTLQDQLSQSLSSGGVIKLADILNLNFQNKGQRSSLDLSLPFLPLTIKVDAKKPPTKETGEKIDSVDKDGLKLLSQLSDVSGNINLGIKSMLDTEASRNSEKDQNKVKPELQKRSSRPSRTSYKRISNKGKSSLEEYDKFSPSNTESVRDWDDESEGVQGRILGDVLFSESTFDKYFRRLLKDHGKWLLDSNISPPKNIIESIRDITRTQFPASTLSKSGSRGEKPDGMIYNSKKESNIHGHQHTGNWRSDAEGRIILAFTPEGLPLKLKIDPSVNKPLKFLHRILSEGRVSLNIPVSTMNGIQAVGNGVLQLGFEDSGMHARTPLLDLSDPNQLNYLLRTLRNLKYEKHSIH